MFLVRIGHNDNIGKGNGFPSPSKKGEIIMGLSIKDMRDNLAREREVVKNMLSDMKAMRVAIKNSRAMQKQLRAQLKEERTFRRIVKEDNRRLEREKRAAARAEKIAARIAKTEARLQALRDKANSPKQIRKNQRKASPVTVYTAEQIAAMNS